MSENKIALLHIHAQCQQHDEAYIIGNKEGLEKLKKAIDLAIDTYDIMKQANPAGYGVMVETADLFTIDGEGFNLFTKLDENEEKWKNRLLPCRGNPQYTGVDIALKDPKTILPWKDQ